MVILFLGSKGISLVVPAQAVWFKGVLPLGPSMGSCAY